MADMSTPLKNTAFTLSFTLYKNDGTIVANPGTYTKKVSIDGAAVADIAASVTEEDTTYGQLSLVIAAGEMNGDWIWVYITDNTAGTVPFTATLYPAAGAHASAAALAAVDSIIDNIHDTDLPAVKAVVDDIPTNAELMTALGTADDATLAAIVSLDAVVDTVKVDTAAILTDTGTTLDGAIAAVDTVVDGIAVEVTQVHAHVAEWVDGGRLDLLLDDAAAGGGGLSEADVRTAVGLASANLDTQIGTVDTVVDAIKAKSDTLPASPAAVGSAMTLTNLYDAAKTALAASAYTAPDNAGITAAGTKADAAQASADAAARPGANMVATNMVAAAPLSTANASAVRTNLTAELARIDEPVSAAKTLTSGERTSIASAVSGLAATGLAALRALLDAVLLKTDTIGGSGAIEWTYTLTTDDGTPIADAAVWVTSDEAGNNVVASGRTNAFGVVTFHMDAGTYFIWAHKSGTNFDNPDEETVTA